jgi:hypothetical protein
MISQAAELYKNLLRGSLILSLGVGFMIGPTGSMKIAAKKSLTHGLVRIPAILK